MKASIEVTQNHAVRRGKHYLRVLVEAQRIYPDEGLPQWGITRLEAWDHNHKPVDLRLSEAAEVLARLP